MTSRPIEPFEQHATEYWHLLADGRVQCDVCPRFCKLKKGQRGLCFVRANAQDDLVLTSYGRSSGFAIDPIEKKPLYHFLPGSRVLSFGTAGCNLACKFCQNWSISKSQEMDRLMDQASPEQIAEMASANNCLSVAYTYNDPVIFLEYAIDTAIACRERGIRSVAVTAGYICEQPRHDFFAQMDAVNIDLKSFNEDFYWRLTGAHLEPVLETLRYVKHQTNTWLEITTLVIPGENDSDEELDALSQWIYTELGAEVPLHFSAFFPAWKMMDTPRTSLKSLLRAREIALNNGLKHVYIGNARHREAESSYCSHCGCLLISREGYQIDGWQLDDQGRCQQCATPLAGQIVLPQQNVD